MKLLEVYKKN